jgi:hypothetical protein
MQFHIFPLIDIYDRDYYNIFQVMDDY